MRISCSLYSKRQKYAVGVTKGHVVITAEPACVNATVFVLARWERGREVID